MPIKLRKDDDSIVMCSAVAKHPGTGKLHPCKHRAKVYVDGRWVCHNHKPEQLQTLRENTLKDREQRLRNGITQRQWYAKLRYDRNNLHEALEASVRRVVEARESLRESLQEEPTDLPLQEWQELLAQLDVITTSLPENCRLADKWRWERDAVEEVERQMEERNATVYTMRKHVRNGVPLKRPKRSRGSG